MTKRGNYYKGFNIDELEETLEKVFLDDKKSIKKKKTKKNRIYFNDEWNRDSDI